MYRYVALRKKLLGVDELHMYDVYVSLTKEYEQKYTYEQAIEIVKKALAVLGDDYVALLDKGFSERWVDVYENEGKKSSHYFAYAGAGISLRVKLYIVAEPDYFIPPGNGVVV